MEWNQLVWCTAIAIFGIGLGYALGMRRSRKARRRAMHKINSQALELLEANSTIGQFKAYAAEQQRKDKLLKLSLVKLRQANKLVARTQQQNRVSEKKHFVALSRMRLRALEARETARKAANIARKATFHLQRLEKASPVTQTIEAPEPKSYGNSDPVTVSVVDQARLDGSSNSVAQVSNRDSARLTKLHSSNEATAS